MARNRILEIAAEVAAAGVAPLKLPCPSDSKVVSERMRNLSYLFGEMRSYAAEGCFKSLADEVELLEAKLNRLAEQHQDALTLLTGWIHTHSPSRYRAEHLADLDKKIAAFKEITRGG